MFIKGKQDGSISPQDRDSKSLVEAFCVALSEVMRGVYTECSTRLSLVGGSHLPMLCFPRAQRLGGAELPHSICRITADISAIRRGASRISGTAVSFRLFAASADMSAQSNTKPHCRGSHGSSCRVTRGGSCLCPCLPSCFALTKAAMLGLWMRKMES